MRLLAAKDREAEERVKQAIRQTEKNHNPWFDIYKQIEFLHKFLAENQVNDESTKHLASNLVMQFEESEKYRKFRQLEDAYYQLQNSIDERIDEAVEDERKRCAEIFRKYTEGQLHAYCNRPLYLGIIYEKILEPPKD